MPKLLLTGGAGYVGSHTAHHLIATGTPAGNLLVFDNLERGHEEFVPEGIELIRGDLRNREAIEEVFRRNEIQAVLHFAAYAYVGESMENAALYFENNVRGGLNLLESARLRGCRTVIFSSSCTVYGTPSKVPITEDAPTRPASPYGESKLAFERMLKWYSDVHGISSVCLRYFNAAGAAYGIGERHDPETHLIPLVLQAALGQRDHLTINGTDYPTADGTCVRDYIHMLDLARGHRKALEALHSGRIKHACVNLGTGHGTSITEVIRIAEEISGRTVPVVNGPRRRGDAPELYADPTKAHTALGWLAELGIRDIIRDAWQWHARTHTRNNHAATL